MAKSKVVASSKQKNKPPIARIRDAPDPTLVIEGQRVRKPTARAGIIAATNNIAALVPKAKSKKASVVNISDDEYKESSPGGNQDNLDDIITSPTSFTSPSLAEKSPDPTPPPPEPVPTKRKTKKVVDPMALEKIEMKKGSISFQRFSFTN